jgi:hypothetical protein
MYVDSAFALTPAAIISEANTGIGLIEQLSGALRFQQVGCRGADRGAVQRTNCTNRTCCTAWLSQIGAPCGS